MKTHTSFWLLGLAGLLTLSAIPAQAGKGRKSVVPEKGYWVVAANDHMPGRSEIRYYNHLHQLVHTEQVSDRRLRAGSRKVQLELKAKTDLAVQVFEQLATRP